jgi:hypothetical protein
MPNISKETRHENKSIDHDLAAAIQSAQFVAKLHVYVIAICSQRPS